MQGFATRRLRDRRKARCKLAAVRRGVDGVALGGRFGGLGHLGATELLKSAHGVERVCTSDLLLNQRVQLEQVDRRILPALCGTQRLCCCTRVDVGNHRNALCDLVCCTARRTTGLVKRCQARVLLGFEPEQTRKANGKVERRRVVYRRYTRRWHIEQRRELRKHRRGQQPLVVRYRRSASGIARRRLFFRRELCGQLRVGQLRRR